MVKGLQSRGLALETRGLPSGEGRFGLSDKVREAPAIKARLVPSSEMIINSVRFPPRPCAMV